VIPHITKGSDMRGLLGYLCSTESPKDPRANQHSSPHVIGGDPFLQVWHGTEELDARAAAEIAAYLDEPRMTFGTEVKTKAWQQDPNSGERVPVRDVEGRQVWRDVHVWHCSLSLADGETLPAEQWEQVTRKFADRMGFTEESGHAPARWVAIHHGEGKGGHDHVHIAASMVREDGTRWEGRFNDWPRSQQVCRDLEAEYGLVRVEGRQHGTATRGATPAELTAQQRTGAPTIAREDLAQRIRAAAVASTSEAEWVRRVRACGVVVKPRFANGSTDVVAGYRAALKGTDRLNFYGGGQVGTDLSLPRLRELWPAPSVEQATEAAGEWQAAFRGRPPVGRGRETVPLARTAPEVARRNLEGFTDRLRTVPATDRVAWSVAARDISGALSAWARLDPTHAADLRSAAAVIGRAAQDRRPAAGPGLRVKESPMGVALVLLAAKGDDRPGIAAAALMAQILRAAAAVRDYHRETCNLREARAVDVELSHLAALKWPGYRPEQQSGRKVAATPTRTPQPVAGTKGGPALQLPTALKPRAQTVAQRIHEREGRDGGR
jgi:hypothetical protein